MSSEKLVIAYTNDIHSHFEQMPKVATAIQSIQQKHKPSEVITLDCGDHMDRMRMETEGSAGRVNVEVLNKTGYEYFVPGNNEGLTFTSGMLTELFSKDIHFKVLCCNMLLQETENYPSWITPYEIIRKGNIKVGLIGVTANFIDFYRLLGWDVQNPFDSLSKYVALVRPQVDILVVLSHLGLTHDRRLAEEMEGIDLIFGGHTHHVFEQPYKINNTYLCATGKFGQYVGELELTYDTKEKRIESIQGYLLDVNTFPDCPIILETIETYKQVSQKILMEPTCSLNEELAISWEQESALGNLLAEGVRTWVNAEIGIVNAGQILQGLKKGHINRGRLLEICPSPINPCKFTLKGEHIYRALEESLLPEFIHKQIRGFGFRGKMLGTLCLDGMEITYDPNEQSYRKIKEVLVNGESLDVERDYVVGSLDMFTFGIGYFPLNEGRNIQYFLPEFIRDVLLKQLCNATAIELSKKTRWKSIETI